MAHSQCPILIVTASVSGHLGRVYEAMGLGALDAVDTPAAGRPDRRFDHARQNRDHRQAGRAWRRSQRSHLRFADAAPTPPVGRNPSWPIVAIGASTGGPAALAEVLSGLPGDQGRGRRDRPARRRRLRPRPGPMADRADRQARRADRARRPAVARTDLDRIDERSRDSRTSLAGSTTPPSPLANHYRPSGDVLFESLARHWPEPGAAAVLTGMGPRRRGGIDDAPPRRLD